MVALANNRRKDLEARQALERVQSRYLQQTGEVSANVCTHPRKLYESLLQEVLGLVRANYGCVLRLTGVELAESPFLELVSVVGQDHNGRLVRQYDTLLNRKPDAIVQTVLSSGSPTWVNNKRSMVPTCLPDCRPPVQNFVILPLVTRRKAPSLLFIANAEKAFNEQTVERIETVLNVFVRIHKQSSATKQAQVAVQRYRQDNRHYTRLLNANFNGVMTVDKQGEVTAINPACERYFDVIGSMACGTPATRYISGHVLEPLIEQARSFDTDVSLSEISLTEPRESIGYRLDGTEFPILVAAFFSRIDGHVCLTLIIDDISDRYESARESEQAFVQMKTLTNLAPVGILQLAVDWTCQYANDMWYGMSDLSSEESLGEGWIDAIHVDDVHEALNDLRESVCSNSVFKKDLRLQKPLGGVTWVNMCATSTIDEQHKLTGFLVVFTDITDKHNAAERLKQLAHHDTLTGLLNRLHFLDKLGEYLSKEASHERIGLLSVDLDGFKAVNDTLGHDAGDVVLREAADRLTRSVRDTDLVARLGGDEFTITLTQLSNVEQAEQIAQKVISTIKAPIAVSNVEVEVSASIGIAVGDIGQIGSDELIKQADVALYRAKQSGKSCSVTFSKELSEEQSKQSALNASIRNAVKHRKFKLVYQPQIDLHSQRILGFEALLRLPEQFGIESMPSQVIQVLEDSGMIAEVGARAISQACEDFVSWKNAGLVADSCTVSVNLSAKQLASPTLLDSVDEAIAGSGIEPSSLVLELTESAFIDNSDLTLKTLHSIKERGISISLDDFGTGFSSLSYLSRLPIDHLKIDRTFVIDLQQSEQGLAIVRAIIALSKALDVSVIAEGVESGEIMQMLAFEGCDAYQGYYFSKAKTADELKIYLADVTPLKLVSYTSFFDIGGDELDDRRIVAESV